MDVTNPPPGGLPGEVQRFGPGSRPVAVGGLGRSSPFVRRVALTWRRLADGGGRTLVACSGGADSTALTMALALTTTDLVVAHVVHDLRPESEALGDRDAAAHLARRLGLRFVEASVRVARESGNPESLARHARYAALAGLARDVGCAFVATAHHADDQFETVLMALMRGAGPRGLRGVAPRRRLDPAETGSPILIRPMLGVTRGEALEACRIAGAGWREDATNRDDSRLRAALRLRVTPILETLRPGAARRAAHAAELLREASAVVDEHVARLFGERDEWPRDVLRREPSVILARGLRRAADRLLAGRARDRFTSRMMSAAVRAVVDASTEPREFCWPGGLRLLVSAGAVALRMPG